ncbi:MauE/DoxX family redox-associated membrane protein [Nonomuraea sp. NPDC050404]|uniref:MauE/DoxX family redox-associated membrane protein n=1 Tax=Nonomuraea sp. NPDC050404 TaxID=3155783 RepID=UPI0033C2CDE1
MDEFLRVFPPVLLVVVFGASSLSKVLRAGAYRDFAASVRDLAPLPARWAPAIAAAVVSAEIVTAGLLLTPGYPAGLVLAAALLGAFAAVAVTAGRRGLRVPCNCFGGGAGAGRRLPLGTPHAVRNLLLAAVALAGLFGDPGVVPGWAGAGLSGVAALVCAALVLRFEDIAALFGPLMEDDSERLARGPR